MFCQSGQTKVAGWHLKPSAVALFQSEYRLPLIDPTLAAYVSATAERLFPVLLVIGLLTRLSALALLFMTAVIDIFVFPDAWPTHGVWATCFLLTIARGPWRGIAGSSYSAKSTVIFRFTPCERHRR